MWIIKGRLKCQMLKRNIKYGYLWESFRNIYIHSSGTWQVGFKSCFVFKLSKFMLNNKRASSFIVASCGTSSIHLPHLRQLTVTTVVIAKTWHIVGELKWWQMKFNWQMECVWKALSLEINFFFFGFKPHDSTLVAVLWRNSYTCK